MGLVLYVSEVPSPQSTIISTFNPVGLPLYLKLLGWNGNLIWSKEEPVPCPKVVYISIIIPLNGVGDGTDPPPHPGSRPIP